MECDSYAEQIKLVSTIWSVLPCKQFKMDATHFIDALPALKGNQELVKSLPSSTICSYFKASTHYNAPLLVCQKGQNETIFYIGTKVNDESEKAPFIAGSLNAKDGDIANQLGDLIYRWKQNAIDASKSNLESLTICIANDPECTLESTLIQIINNKEEGGLEKSLISVIKLPHAVVYALNDLITYYREKDIEAAMKKRKAIEEKKRNAKAEREKEESERKRRKLVKKQALKDNEDLVGKKVVKSFEFEGKDALFYGKVCSFEPEGGGLADMWHVEYADGDGEDVEKAELLSMRALYFKVQKQLKAGVELNMYTPQG